jgi:TolB-like protein
MPVLSLLLEQGQSRKFVFAVLLATFAASCGLCTVGWAGSRAMGKGTLWVFAVGVSHYRNKMIDLQYADNDADTLTNALRDRAAGVFADVKTKVLVNEQATRQSILDGMKSFFSQANPDDTGVIALMGHGVIWHGVSYFVPYSADMTNLATEGLPVSDFDKAVENVSARVKKLALLLDTCHADAFSPNPRDLSQTKPRPQQARGIALVDAVAGSAPETFVLSASQGDESSWEDANYRLPGEQKGHGAFTYALLSGLRESGEVQPYQGAIYIEELAGYVSHKAYERTGGKQTPIARTHSADFPIARALDPPSTADFQQAASLLQQGETARQKGQLPLAKDALAKAAQLNPKDQVARVLSDETSADAAYRDDPNAEHDMVTAAANLFKRTGYKGPDDPWAPRPMVIAFLDFSTAGGSPEHAGLHDALVARITQALQGSKRVRVVDRRLIAEVLQEQKLSMSDLSDPATRLKVGQILASRLIATGDVASIDKDKYSVELQMIDTETTEIKVNLSEPLDGSDKIFAVADKTANDILNHVEQDYPLKGKIVHVDGDQVVLDIGSNAGATTGTRMNAVAEESIKVNGEVIATKLNRVGSVEITEVQPKASFAKVIEHSVALKPETKVIEAANRAPSSLPAEHSSPATTPTQ